jgi:acetyl esterase/lipase
MSFPRKSYYIILIFLSLAESTFSQEYSSSIKFPYRISYDVTYLEIGSWEAKLDIYARRDKKKQQPTLIWIHGGSVKRGSKDGSLFSLLPYLEKGFNVINLEPRLPGLTTAPAAVQNCQCALKWIYKNADKYNIDTTKLVISGGSSGGWFAIAAAMSLKTEGWDKPCPGPGQTSVAAVVNWYGNWDLADVLDGPNAKSYASGWVPLFADPMEVAKSLSPMPFDDRAVPTISIHGDADNVVPYSQSTRLHEALKAKGIAEQLVTIIGGGHGRFSRLENEEAFETIWDFLDQLGISTNY